MKLPIQALLELLISILAHKIRTVKVSFRVKAHKGDYMWLLIVVFAYSSQSGVDSNHFEFTSKEKCLKAQERIMIGKSKVYNSFDAFCAEK